MRQVDSGYSKTSRGTTRRPYVFGCKPLASRQPQLPRGFSRPAAMICNNKEAQLVGTRLGLVILILLFVIYVPIVMPGPQRQAVE